MTPEEIEAAAEEDLVRRLLERADLARSESRFGDESDMRYAAELIARLRRATSSPR